MRIYVLPVASELQPPRLPFRYPAHSADYGVEQDFLNWISKRADLRTERPDSADFHYLPVYWTRYQLGHKFGSIGQDRLRNLAQSAIIDDRKTFTVCQYDDGPKVDIGATVLFLSSRKTDVGIDIPLLCSPHRLPWRQPKKRYLASFVGRAATHPIRASVFEAVKERADFYLYSGDRGAKFFVEKTLASYVCLAPRGCGGSSFRAFEAMQLGVPPFFISDIDTRPFKDFIPWSECSLTTTDPGTIVEQIEGLRDALIPMGEAAKKLYNDYLAFGKWCALVTEELRRLL